MSEHLRAPDDLAACLDARLEEAPDDAAGSGQAPANTARAEGVGTAVEADERVKLGSLLADMGRELGGIDLDITRDKVPPVPLGLE
ncbi:plasmid stability protein [Variovorax sp. dw_954]|uniref:plasmid stability protein n=1 Tax=Variovorax sp. dw_954 TaxID=2720078 RepID=UPI001BD5B77B|nr:plasmid stability protein [Variovorax sp. dw_954]